MIEFLSLLKSRWSQQLGRWIISWLVKVPEFQPLNHLAIIMDGNRRYAKKHQVPAETGHSHGFDALRRIMDACHDAQIHHLTVFAFSIDNFKRTPKEVETLMNLACEKFSQFCESSDSVQKLKVKVKILGDLDLLPDRVRAAAIRVMEMTKNHDQYFLNICMPYTSMHEIHRAVDLYHSSSSVSAVTDDNNNDDNDADRPRFEDFLFTKESPEVDVLVRTSGESRLSDFLLWQISNNSNTLCYFESILWPDFTVWHLIVLFIRFQCDRLFSGIKSQ